MSNLSLPFAEAVPILLPAYDELNLILIGCGGTGGWLAVNLPRIAYLPYIQQVKFEIRYF